MRNVRRQKDQQPGQGGAKRTVTVRDDAGGVYVEEIPDDMPGPIEVPLTGGGAAELVPVGDLHTYPGNPNHGDIDAIARSLGELGQYRPIVVNRGTLTGRPMEVLAGNHTYLAARDVRKWQAVQAWVIDVDEEDAATIVAGDNQLAALGKTSEADLLALLSKIDDQHREAAGFTQADMDRLIRQAEAAANEDEGAGGASYSSRITAPQYQITGERPAVADLVDRTKVAALMDAIADAEVPPEVNDFLMAAATRHYRFRYDRIAEFYAHAEPAVQRLMEDSALVIIDFDDAIRGGYVTLSRRLAALLKLELTERDVEIVDFDPEADAEESLR